MEIIMSDNCIITVEELYAALSENIPSSLSCEWDNDGMSVCPDASRAVSRIVLALDPDEDAVNFAVSGEFDCLITHHPMLFKGLKAVDGNMSSSKKVISLIKNNISAMSFHTRLDALEGGVNDRLCELLGIKNAKSFGQNGEEIGRIGYLDEPMQFEDFARLVKERLGAPTVTAAGCGKPAFCVAVLGGGGEDDVYAAEAAGADTYVTGELKYHQLCDAPYSEMSLIEAGHYYTEFPVLSVLEEMILKIFAERGLPSPEIKILASDRIKSI